MYSKPLAETVHSSNAASNLEAQLQAAQKEIQTLQKRLCKARAMHCRVEGTAHFVNTSAGAWNSFDILAVDELGIPCESGGDNFIVEMTGPTNGEVQVVDNNDGTYTANCRATQVGNYTITVSLEGHAQIAFLPNQVTVHAIAPDPEMCVAKGLGLKSMQAGFDSCFEICCFDMYGNPAPLPLDDELERIDVLLTGGASFEIERLQNAGEGVYLVQYVVRDEADWTIDILLDGQPIRDSPFLPGFDAGATDPSQSHVLGEVFEQDIDAGSEWTISLIAKDAFGNNRILGGDDVNVAVTSPDGNVQLLPKAQGPKLGCWWDVGDGTYHASYQFTMAGEYEVDVGIAGALAGGGVKSVFVSSATAAPEMFVADLEGLRRGVAGEPMHFVMAARDIFGNACPLDLSRAAVTMITDELEVEGSLIPMHDDPSVCEVELFCTTAGSYRLETIYNGDLVPAAQLELTVLANETKPTCCELFSDTDPKRAAGTTDGLSEAYLGIPAQFYVQVKDEFGNKRTVGGDEVKVTCLPDDENPVPPAGVHLADLGDGSYRVTYLACKAGPHRLNITVNGFDIDCALVVNVIMGCPPRK